MDSGKARWRSPLLTAVASARRASGALSGGVQRALEKNYQRLMQEARETGELSVLLARAARGQPLTADERQRMRAQLIDIAKAIPALAIFAAPGGLLLLLVLTKVLRFNLLPSAFQDAPPLALPAPLPGEPRDEKRDEARDEKRDEAPPRAVG